MLIPLLAALAAPSPSPFIDPWPDIRLVGWWSRGRTDTAHLASSLDARVLRPAGRGVSISLEWRFDDDGPMQPQPDPLDLDPLDLDPLDLDPLDLDDPWFAPDAFAGLPLTPPDPPVHPTEPDDGADGDDHDVGEPPVADPRLGDPAPPDDGPPDRAARGAMTATNWARRLTDARRALATATDRLDREQAQLDLDEARQRLALSAPEAAR